MTDNTPQKKRRAVRTKAAVEPKSAVVTVVAESAGAESPKRRGPRLKPKAPRTGPGRVDKEELEARWDLYEKVYKRMECSVADFANFMYCGSQTQNQHISQKLKRRTGITQSEKNVLMLANFLMDNGFLPALAEYDEEGTLIDIPKAPRAR